MMKRVAHLVFPATLACALSVSVSASAADPATTPERTLARSLFEQARALAHDGKFAQACPKFEESARLAPGIGTSFNLGDCLEHTGQLASAWSAFTDAADQARRAGQDDRETAARSRAASLAPRLSRIELSLAPPLPTGLTVALDGRELGAAVLRSPLPVDPGDHRVRASAPGRTPSEVTVHVDTSARLQQIEIPPLAPEPPPAAQASAILAPVPALISPSSPPDSAATGHGLGWQKTGAIAAGGLALVGLGIGSYFGLHARSQWSDAQAQCPGNVCSPSGYQGWDDAHGNARVGTALFISAGVLAVGGVVLWLTAPSSSSSVSAQQARR